MTTNTHLTIDSLIAQVARKEALIVATRAEIKQLKEQIQRRLSEVGILASVGNMLPTSLPPVLSRNKRQTENPYKAAAIANIDEVLTKQGLNFRVEPGTIERLATQYGYALTTMQHFFAARLPAT